MSTPCASISGSSGLSEVESEPSADAGSQLVATPADRPTDATHSATDPGQGNRTAVNASAWSVLGYAVSQTLRLLNNMLLSYLLVPEAFGTMALINIVIIGLGMFCEVGVGPAIIQNDRGDDPDFLNTAWIIQVARGFAITACSVVLAWPIAQFYNEPSLVWLIPVAALTSLISGFCSTSVFTLQRHLNVKAIAFLEIKSQFLGSLAMCIFAWFNPSVWALVIGSIVTSTSKTAISHRLIPDYRNRWKWNWPDARELYGFGKWIFISTLLTFGTMQIDRMMLGKLFDIRTLGVYSFAFAIAMMPRLLVEKLCGSVLYPVLAQAKRESLELMADKLRAARRVLLCVESASVISVLAGCQWFFTTLYHEDFHAAGDICQWLCGITWIATLSMTLSRALVAMGNTRALAAYNLVNVISMIIFGLAGHHLAGLPGFVGGLVCGVTMGHVAITVALAKHSVLLISQDVRQTLTLLLAAAVVIGVQRWSGWGMGSQLFVFAVICGIFWHRAVNEVRWFRAGN